MKSFLHFGEETTKPYQTIKFRCDTDKNMNIILKKLNETRKTIKIYYELPLENPYNCDWGGLPQYLTHPDTYPILKIQFSKEDDKKQFYKTINREYLKRNSDFYPHKPMFKHQQSFWTSNLPMDKQINKYPIFVISKGRYEKRFTSDYLSKCKIKHYLVIEHCEKKLYEKDLKEHVNLLVMNKKYDNLGKGSIPVRNWIDKKVKKSMKGTLKYWCLDDNMNGFYRFYKNTRIEMRTPLIFRITEEFSDRYENLHLCGLQYYSFCPDISKRRTLCGLNTRIYSCMLISTKLKDVLGGVLWRGRYNEDTDLSLRILKKGLPTVLMYQFLCHKMTTLSCKGGNTDTIYKDDGLQKKLDSLIKQHPDVVKGTIKFKKVHHQVNYKPFIKNKLILKKDVVVPKEYYDWGLYVRLDF